MRNLGRERIFSAGILLWLLVTLPAFADAVLYYSETSSNGTQPEVVLINSRYVRIESGQDSQKGMAQFDVHSGKIWLFDHQHQTVTELSTADIEHSRRLDEKLLSQRFDQITITATQWSQDEREALQSLRSRLQSITPPQALSIEVKGHSQVAGISCTQVNINWSATLRDQHCMSNANDLGLNEEEAVSIQTLLNLTFSLSGYEIPSEAKGIPVSSVHEDDGDRHELVLDRIEKHPISATRFATPENYTKKPAAQF